MEYQTRDGRPAKILMRDAGGRYPVIVAIQTRQGPWVPTGRTADLRVCADGMISPADIIPVPKETIVFINEYTDGRFGAPHITRGDADACVLSGRTRAHVHRVIVPTPNESTRVK